MSASAPATNAFDALADDTRRGIVMLLARRGELPASQISRNFDMTAPAVSQHLKILRACNVIQMKKQAQMRLYSVNTAGLAEMEKWLTDVRRLWQKRFQSLDQYLTRLKKERSSGKA